MKIVLRFEADGYLPSKANSIISSSKAIVRQRCPPNAAIGLSDESSHSNLRVIAVGHDVPHSSLIEMKTCKENRLFTNRVIDQLWFGQVRHVKIGYHSEGTFKRIEARDFQEEEEFRRFARIKGQGLGKMTTVIDNIRRMMKEHSIIEAVLIYEEESLHLYKKYNESHALPHDLLSRWNTPANQMIGS